MAHPVSNRPSAGETQILKILWAHPHATVVEVHRELSRDREIGRTTVLKAMQIMQRKGLIVRDRSRPARYSAKSSESQTTRGAVLDVVNRLFGGSAKALIHNLLSAKKSSPKELEEIQKVLDELARKK